MPQSSVKHLAGLIAARSGFQRGLLRWYDNHRRALPWRGISDPYRIWVSEIMLQQTRAAAVVGYYERFIKTFPTVHALAAAREAEALAAWSGLGYYRRARMLHSAARQVVYQRKGVFPSTSAGLRELPGIGRYTAAAVASIAFGEAIAVVDGNVERVLLRLAGASEEEGMDFWGTIQRLVNHRRPGDFNQAMMELGATVCLPRNPLCKACPVMRWCGTRGEHAANRRAPRRAGTLHYVLARRGNAVRLIERAATARLMPGMWELPAGERCADEPLLRLKHSITNTDFEVVVTAGKSAAGRWIQPRRLHQLPLTGVTRKILRRLGLFTQSNMHQYNL